MQRERQIETVKRNLNPIILRFLKSCVLQKFKQAGGSETACAPVCLGYLSEKVTSTAHILGNLKKKKLIWKQTGGGNVNNVATSV